MVRQVKAGGARQARYRGAAKMSKPEEEAAEAAARAKRKKKLDEVREKLLHLFEYLGRHGERHVCGQILAEIERLIEAKLDYGWEEPEERYVPGKIEETKDHLDTVYTALGKSTEYWVVSGRGAFAFRFGPYTGPEVSEIMKKAVDRGIGITIIGQCGREFDWQLAEDMGTRLVLKDKEAKT
jgi:hypothetical protein